MSMRHSRAVTGDTDMRFGAATRPISVACAGVFLVAAGCHGGAHGMAGRATPAGAPSATALAGAQASPLAERVREIEGPLAPRGISLAGTPSTGFITRGVGVTTAF